MRLTVLAALLLVACGGSTPPPAVDGAPWVVLVTIDTLRADATSPYGAPPEMTPHLTALAARSLQYDRAHAAMPTTGPSHLAMLTGRYPQEVGALQNGQPARPGTQGLADVMRASGRRTAAFVSVHHLSRETLRLDGFETWDAPEEVRDGKDTVAAACDWVADQDGAPFFLWVHLFDPHQPYKAHDAPPPQIAAALAPLAGVEVAGHGGFAAAAFTPSEREKLALLYQADVHYADAQVGRLLACLPGEGRADGLALALTSDHGEVLGEAMTGFGYGFDHGEFLLPMEVRVPLWVQIPGGPRGAVEKRTVETRALFGTLAAAGGVALPDALRLPGLGPDGAGDVPDPSAFVVRRSFQSPDLPDVLRGTRLAEASGGTLLVRAEHAGRTTLEPWRCDDAHPTGLAPVALPEAETARRLAALDVWAARVTADGAAPAGPVDAATKERLRALGYLD